MEKMERQVWREARAMTRREVITKAIAKQLTWIQASEIIGVSARHMRRMRRKVEVWGMSAVMDQRGGRPRRKRIKAGTIELLCRLKRDVYPDFWLQHFTNTSLRSTALRCPKLVAADAAGSRDRGARTRTRQVSPPARAPAASRHADPSGCFDP